MRVDSLRKEEIDYIIDNLWERGRKEADLFGMGVEGLREMFYGICGGPFNMAFFANGEKVPSAILALQHVNGDGAVWRTFFAATEEGFNKMSFEITFFIAKLSRDMADKFNCLHCFFITSVFVM